MSEKARRFMLEINASYGGRCECHAVLFLFEQQLWNAAAKIVAATDNAHAYG